MDHESNLKKELKETADRVASNTDMLYSLLHSDAPINKSDFSFIFSAYEELVEFLKLNRIYSRISSDKDDKDMQELERKVQGSKDYILGFVNRLIDFREIMKKITNNE